jgi:hypothetical protein
MSIWGEDKLEEEQFQERIKAALARQKGQEDEEPSNIQLDSFTRYRRKTRRVIVSTDSENSDGLDEELEMSSSVTVTEDIDDAAAPNSGTATPERTRSSSATSGDSECVTSPRSWCATSPASSVGSRNVSDADGESKQRPKPFLQRARSQAVALPAFRKGPLRKSIGIALVDYVGDGGFSFKVGDEIELLIMDQSAADAQPGLLLGKIAGVQGVFPCEYIKRDP